MMRKQSIEGRNQFAMLTIDDLVPKDHLVRKIDAAIQFDFIYPIHCRIYVFDLWSSQY